MDRRLRAHQWRRARRSYNRLCPPVGRRAAAALLWLSCSIALLRALLTSNARAQQRAAAQQRRIFLNAHHRSAAQVFPASSDSDSEPEETEEVYPSLPDCPGYEDDFDYDIESDIESESEFHTETETAPTTEPETEPEDERGPVVSRQSPFAQSLAERLYALRLQSPDASPRRTQAITQEPRSPREGEEPQREDRDPSDPRESAKPGKEQQQQRGCNPSKPSKPSGRDPSPEPPSKRGPIPIRRY